MKQESLFQMAHRVGASEHKRESFAVLRYGAREFALTEGENKLVGRK